MCLCMLFAFKSIQKNSISVLLCYSCVSFQCSYCSTFTVYHLEFDCVITISHDFLEFESEGFPSSFPSNNLSFDPLYISLFVLIISVNRFCCTVVFQWPTHLLKYSIEGGTSDTTGSIGHIHKHSKSPSFDFIHFLCKGLGTR